MSTTYTATVTREDGWWMVHVPAIDGLTQARRISEAGQMARELIALSKGVPIDDVTVEVSVREVEGLDVTAALESIRADRARAAQLERDATARATALARSLAARKLTVRDIGAILGVSHQRAHQLVH